MNICIVGSSKKFYSGVSLYTVMSANALAQKGHQVSVILLRNLLPLFLYPGRDRVGKREMLVRFLPGIDVYEGMDWNSPSSWLGARRFLKERAPEAVIMHWWTSSVAHMQIFLAACCDSLPCRGALVLEMHEVVDPLEAAVLPIRLYSRMVGMSLVRRSGGFVVHSTEAGAAVREVYRAAPEKIFVVPHGPYGNYGFFPRKEAAALLGLEDSFNILHFGMIRRHKGVPLLTKAFGQLPPEVANRSNLLIIGEDWGEDPDISPTIESCPYRNRIVRIAEFIPDEEVSQYFAAADIIILPYHQTCGSGVVNIAVAQGKPIITSDLSTMRECLDGYGAAEFFPVNDVAALRDTILEAFKKWEKGKLVTTTPIIVTWDGIVAGYEKIVSELRSCKCILNS